MLRLQPVILTNTISLLTPISVCIPMLLSLVRNSEQIIYSVMSYLCSAINTLDCLFLTCVPYYGNTNSNNQNDNK